MKTNKLNKLNKFMKSKNRCGEVLDVYKTDGGYKAIVSVLLHPHYWSKERKKTFFLSDATMFESMIMEQDIIVFTVEKIGNLKFEMYNIKEFNYDNNRGTRIVEGTNKTIDEYCTFNQKLWSTRKKM